MKNKIFFLLTCTFLSNSSAFAVSNKTSDDSKVNETQKILVSSQVEYARACIDRKCQKIKEKIRKLGDEFHNIEKYDEEAYGSDPMSLDKRRIELTNKIKKYEKKLETFRTMKLSLEIIDFESL